jgi:hypothetical protein
MLIHLGYQLLVEVWQVILLAVVAVLVKVSVRLAVLAAAAQVAINLVLELLEPQTQAVVVVAAVTTAERTV